MRYGDVIKPIQQTKNIYRQGLDLTAEPLKVASGEFIALIHGDDYWCDDLKLQKQFDQIIGRPDLVVSYHDSLVVDSSGLKLSDSKLSLGGCRDRYTQAELQLAPKLPTQTLFFKNVIKNYPPELAFAFGGDKFLLSLLGAFGGAEKMSEVTPSVFRSHSGGVNRGVTSLIELKICHATTRLALYKYHARIGNASVAQYFRREYIELCSALTAISAHEKKGVFDAIKEYFPFSKN